MSTVRTWTRYVLGLASCALVLAGASVADADPWGTETTETGAHPDEDPHTYCFAAGVSSDLMVNITWAEENSLAPTQAAISFHTTCQTTGAGETDVTWIQVDLPGDNLEGQAYCDDHESGTPNQCDQFYAKLDIAAINVGSLDETNQDQTACHELGHTAGLTHGGASNDCMYITGSTPIDQAKYSRYGDHHTIHINDWF